MDGQDQMGSWTFPLEGLAEPDHRNIEEVGGQSLDRGIDGRALVMSPQFWVGGENARQPSAASIQIGHIALGSC